MPKPAPTRRRTAPPITPFAPKQTFEIVDPRWLLKALGICFVAALFCGYATLCLLFYQGSWQSVLHPSRTVDRTPGFAGLAFTALRFDATETGQPRLTGWWIPATPSSHDEEAILYLHGGSGSLADTIPALTLLHQTGLNIFAIDYRGYGASDAASHPPAESMAQDTAAALDYLVNTRHIPASTIIPFGEGLGGSLAANLALAHPELPAVILDNPIADPAGVAVAAHPSDPVPVRLLFGNQFAIAKPLALLSTPKLLISGGPLASGTADQTKMQALFTQTASPRITVTLPEAASSAAYLDALSRFFDQYLIPGKMLPLSPNSTGAHP